MNNERNNEQSGVGANTNDLPRNRQVECVPPEGWRLLAIAYGQGADDYLGAVLCVEEKVDAEGHVEFVTWVWNAEDQKRAGPGHGFGNGHYINTRLYLPTHKSAEERLIFARKAALADFHHRASRLNLFPPLAPAPRQEEPGGKAAAVEVVAANSTVPRVGWKEFAEKYCARQIQTEEGLARELWLRQYTNANGGAYDGFVMFECQMLDSSKLGNLVIMPFGERAFTFKELPKPGTTFSPQGLASDMSLPVCWVAGEDVPREVRG